MIEFRDNEIRNAVLIKYLNSNVILVLINLGAGVAMQISVRLSRVYVLDEDGMRDYFKELEGEDISIKLYDKPEAAAYYLAEMYYESNQGCYINANEELINSDIAKMWEQKK